MVSGIKVATTGNPDLKWETTTQTNIGLDAYLFNGAVSLGLDYYWKNTKDMITIPPVLSVAGENAAKFMNTGEMKNHGFELNLGYHSPQYGDFSWDANLNMSMYRNELVRLNDEVSIIGGDFRLIEGQPMAMSATASSRMPTRCPTTLFRRGRALDDSSTATSMAMASSTRTTAASSAIQTPTSAWV